MYQELRTARSWLLTHFLGVRERSDRKEAKMTCFLFPGPSWPPPGAARFLGWVARPAAEAPMLRSFPRIP